MTDDHDGRKTQKLAKKGTQDEEKKREKKPNLIGMFIRMSSNMFGFFSYQMST
jgi:hypothetical protein